MSVAATSLKSCALALALFCANAGADPAPAPAKIDTVDIAFEKF